VGVYKQVERGVRELIVVLEEEVILNYKKPGSPGFL
jgi:hypothetical protein